MAGDMTFMPTSQKERLEIVRRIALFAEQNNWRYEFNQNKVIILIPEYTRRKCDITQPFGMCCTRDWHGNEPSPCAVRPVGPMDIL